jgi:reverse gyrase
MFENLGRPRCRTSGDFSVIGGGYPNCIPVCILGFVVQLKLLSSRRVREVPPLLSLAMAPPLQPLLLHNTLEQARRKASEDSRYDSKVVREHIINEFKQIFEGRAPYDWQVDITDAILLGLDTTVIAGTGSGKTIPFILPLLAEERKKKMVLIISPLKELQKDQVSRFEKMGFTATALNQDTWSTEIEQASDKR